MKITCSFIPPPVTCMSWQLTTAVILLDLYFCVLHAATHYEIGSLFYRVTSKFSQASIVNSSNLGCRESIVQVSNEHRGAVRDFVWHWRMFVKQDVVFKVLGAHLSKENFYLLTIYTLTSLCIFSILFSIHFQQADKENLFNNQELLLLVINFLFSWLSCLIQGGIY